MRALERIGGLKLGWGLLVGWLFATYYTEIVPVGRYVGEESAILWFQTLQIVLPLLFAIVAIMALVLAERRSAAILRSTALPLIAAVSVTIGTVVAFFAGDVLLMVVGDAFTGLGSSTLWILWGEEYTRGYGEDTENAALVSAVIAAVLTGFASALPQAAALVLVALLPLASGVLLVLARRGRVGQGDDTAETPVAADGHPGFRAFWSSFLKSGLALFGMSVFLSLLQGICPDSSNNSLPFYAGLLVSIAFVLVVGRVSTSGPRRISVAFLFRWAMPVIIAGFALIVALGAPFGYETAYDLAVMGRLAFCAVTQLYFSRFVERGMASAMVAYGLGWLFLHVGDLVGTCIAIPLSGAVASGALGAGQVAAVCIICVAVCSLIPFGAEPTYTRAVEEPVPEPAPETAPVTEALKAAPAVPAADAESPDAVYERKLDELAARYKLTPRETQVFGLLMRGRSVPFIRDELVISRDTVATHVKHIYSKTGVHSRQELLDLAE